ncbi:MAG: HYR domain-containing protein [Phycisphaerales bacterium]|nr:HYR domain-containing protein [Phycisphaerales bacterium]
MIRQVENYFKVMTSGLICFLATSALWNDHASAGTFVFDKVADTSTSMPGGGGNFSSLFDASISGDNVVFFGSNSNFSQTGVYAKFGAGAVSLIANKSQPAPGGVGNFLLFQCPTISGNNVIFIAKDSNANTGGSEGLFSKFGASPIGVIANQSTPVPSGSSLFTDVGFHTSISGSAVSFRGARVPDFGGANDRQEGVYTTAGGLRRIANKGTAVPGGTGTFNGEPSGIGNFNDPVIEGMDTVFQATGTSNQEGFYHFNGTSGTLSAIVDKSDTIPGTASNFTDFDNFTYDFDGSYTVFRGQNDTGAFPNVIHDAGVYVANVSTGNIMTVADLDTTVPGTTDTFDLNSQFGDLSPFSTVAISGGNVLFIADESSSSNVFSLFLWEMTSGVITRIVGPGDTVDGKEVMGVGFRVRGGGAYDGEKFVVSITFTDNSKGVFVGQEDPPTCDPDNNDPTIECPDDLVVNTDDDDCVATEVSLGSPVADDFCGVDTVTDNAPDSFPLGETTVTWTVTDTSGRMATCEQIVTVEDNQDPTISDCPSDPNVSTDPGACTAEVTWTPPTADDNCNVASFISSHDPGDTFPVGSTIVTYTATDDAGNARECSFDVHVFDEEDPTITCPADVTVSTDPGECSASGLDLGAPDTDDNCGVDDVTNDAPASFPAGETTVVTWTVTDTNGNTETCEQLVTVNDDEDPTITCPTNVTVSTDAGECTASGVDLGAPATGDNCGVDGLINDAPAVFPLGTTTVTWTVNDEDGNTATCQQTVTVNDSENPNITACPTNRTLLADENCQAVVPDVTGETTATDNCDNNPTITQVPAAGTVIGLGDTEVTVSATDASGNISTCMLTITVDANGCNAQADDDGVSDATENGAPNNGDGNNDGTPDSEQNNVTSLPNLNGDFLTVAAPSGTTLANVSSGNNPSPADAPAGVVFPAGFISYEVNNVPAGGQVQIQIIADLPAGTTIDTYWKFGPEPTNPTPHWYEFLFDGTTGAEIDGNVITLNLTDGQRGDDDLTANGTIADPGAPATQTVVVPQPAPDCGTGLCASGMPMTTPFLLIGWGILKRQNRRRRRLA